MRGGERVSEEDLAVGRRLAAARTAANLTQAAAASRLGFAQSRVAKLEIGTRRLLFSEAIDLADLYGVEIDDFVVPRIKSDPGPARTLGRATRRVDKQK